MADRADLEQRLVRAAALVGERQYEYAELAAAVAGSTELRSAVAQVAEVLTRAYHHGGRVLLLGNGGSAADAQHVAAEFVGRCTMDREPLAALALGDNLATVTAIGNDYGYDEVFARQVRAHARPGDVVVAMTTSGRSPNVLRALEAARDLGVTTVALTGRSGGEVVADHVLRVPSDHTGRVQEVHMAWCHMWVESVEQALTD